MLELYLIYRVLFYGHVISRGYVLSPYLCALLFCVGMLSHQLKQHIIDGEKTIIQNPTDQQR